MLNSSEPHASGTPAGAPESPVSESRPETASPLPSEPYPPAGYAWYVVGVLTFVVERSVLAEHHRRPMQHTVEVGVPALHPPAQVIGHPEAVAFTVEHITFHQQPTLGVAESLVAVLEGIRPCCGSVGGRC